MLHVIEHPTRHLFFTGKGGAGKTSLAAGTAITLADRGRRVLLVSTDPASNLGQVLESDVGDSIRNVDAVRGLSTLNIDPEAAAQAYRDRVIDPVRDVLPRDAVSSMVVTPMMTARAASEHALIERVQHELAGRSAIVPMKAEQPVGAAHLRELVTGAGTPEHSHV